MLDEQKIGIMSGGSSSSSMSSLTGVAKKSSRRVLVPAELLEQQEIVRDEIDYIIKKYSKCEEQQVSLESMEGFRDRVENLIKKTSSRDLSLKSTSTGRTGEDTKKKGLEIVVDKKKDTGRSGSPISIKSASAVVVAKKNILETSGSMETAAAASLKSTEIKKDPLPLLDKSAKASGGAPAAPPAAAPKSNEEEKKEDALDVLIVIKAPKVPTSEELVIEKEEQLLKKLGDLDTKKLLSNQLTDRDGDGCSTCSGYLDMSHRKWVVVPLNCLLGYQKELGGGQNCSCSSLNLGHNQLIHLQQRFAISFRHIYRLELQDNRLTSLSENFGVMSQLRDLNLAGNMLERLPLSFAYLKSLRLLNLADNPLTPVLKSVAGPCSGGYLEYERCATNVVLFMNQILVIVNEQSKKAREREEKKAQELEREELEEIKASAPARSSVGQIMRDVMPRGPRGQRGCGRARSIFKNKDDSADVNRFYRNTKKTYQKLDEETEADQPLASDP